MVEGLNRGQGGNEWQQDLYAEDGRAQTFQQEHAQSPRGYAPRPPVSTASRSPAEAYKKIAILGVVILLMGLMVMHYSPMLTNYTSTTRADANIVDDMAHQKTLVVVGDMLLDVGVAMIMLSLLLFGFTENAGSDRLRGYAFISAALVLLARLMFMVFPSTIMGFV